jgi:hypothetical protein
VTGPEGQPQSRRIQVGITDGAATEVVAGELKEGEMIIIGQNVPGASQTRATQTAPGFGGATGGGRRR